MDELYLSCVFSYTNGFSPLCTLFHLSTALQSPFSSHVLPSPSIFLSLLNPPRCLPILPMRKGNKAITKARSCRQHGTRRSAYLHAVSLLSNLWSHCSDNIRMQTELAWSLAAPGCGWPPCPGRQEGSGRASHGPFHSLNKSAARTAAEPNAQWPCEPRPAEAINHPKPSKPAHPAGRHVWSPAEVSNRSIKDGGLPGTDKRTLLPLTALPSKAKSGAESQTAGRE